MNSRSEKKELWTCPDCGRQFLHQGQLHSCNHYSIEQHFKNKKISEALYKKFKSAVKKRVGSFQVESLECCIHFVDPVAFAAVKIMKDKIRIDFGLNEKLKSKRIVQKVPMSSKSTLYCVDVADEHEIDNELLDWIEKAHDKIAEKTLTLKK